MKKVLIIAGDVLPLPGYPTTGAGLRAWSLGQGLAGAGFDVHYSMPEFHVKPDSTGPERELSWHPDNRERPMRLLKPDLVVVCHWPAMPAKKLEIPTVLDLHGPHLMERRFWDRTKAQEGVHEKVLAFSKADFFICAGERQRYYFSNWLLLAGFTLRSEIIKVVPVSLSPDIPQRSFSLSATNDPLLVYGGLFLPWQNPVRPLTALLEAMDDTGKGHLKLFGGSHPIVKDQSDRFDTLLEKLSKNPRVDIISSIPHEKLIKVYLKANIAFDLMEPNLERELAFTTRTVEYLWCGLPVIYNDYAELSDLIESNNAGWSVTPDNIEIMKKKFVTILTHPEDINNKGKEAQAAIKACLTWDKTIQPLADYCHNPVCMTPPKPLLYKAEEVPNLYSKLKRYFHRP